MNLNQNPTQDQLKALIAAADDEAGHHILWVDAAGEVRVSLLPEDIMPVGWEDKFPSTRLRYETFCVGNGYVGAEAAEDEEHVGRLYRSLTKEWAEHSGRNEANFIDHF